MVHLDVADDALVARLTARRQCPECRRIYNLLSQPPRVAGQCDDDHAPLLIRDDDCEAVIRRRLRRLPGTDRTDPAVVWQFRGPHRGWQPIARKGEASHRSCRAGRAAFGAGGK